MSKKFDYVFLGNLPFQLNYNFRQTNINYFNWPPSIVQSSSEPFKIEVYTRRMKNAAHLIAGQNRILNSYHPNSYLLKMQKTEYTWQRLT